MADKEISSLPKTPQITDDSLLPVFVPGAASPAQAATGKQFADFAKASAVVEAVKAATFAENAKASADRAEQARDEIELNHEELSQAVQKASNSAAIATEQALLALDSLAESDKNLMLTQQARGQAVESAARAGESMQLAVEAANRAAESAEDAQIDKNALSQAVQDASNSAAAAQGQATKAEEQGERAEDAAEDAEKWAKMAQEGAAQDRGIPGGLATLGEDGKLSDTQIPGLSKLGAMGFRRLLTASDDMNNLFEDGVYVYSTSSRPANAPFENAAVVEVLGANSTTTQKIQMAYRYGEKGHCAFRPLYNSTWNDWSYFMVKDTSAAPNAADFGAVPLDGGTSMTGSLKVNDGKGQVSAADDRVRLYSLYGGKEFGFVAYNPSDSETTLIDRFRVLDSGKGYNLLHSGNKPSGLYKGTGAAWAEPKVIGGNSRLLAIFSQNTIIFVSECGGVMINTNKPEITYFGKSELNFTGGNLTATITGAPNSSGIGYHYQVL